MIWNPYWELSITVMKDEFSIIAWQTIPQIYDILRFVAILHSWLEAEMDPERSQN